VAPAFTAMVPVGAVLSRMMLSDEMAVDSLPAASRAEYTVLVPLVATVGTG